MVLIVILLAASGVVYLLASSSDDTAMQEMAQQSNNPPKEDALPVPQQTTQPGAYVDYSADVVANTKGTKILFFHASWCPQCQKLEADIKQSGVPSGVTIIKIDYDNSQSLRQQYGVTLQTTMVLIDDNGRLIKKFVAYDEPSLEAVKRNLL